MTEMSRSTFRLRCLKGLSLDYGLQNERFYQKGWRRVKDLTGSIRNENGTNWKGRLCLLDICSFPTVIRWRRKTQHYWKINYKRTGYRIENLLVLRFILVTPICLSWWGWTLSRGVSQMSCSSCISSRSHWASSSISLCSSQLHWSLSAFISWRNESSFLAISWSCVRIANWKDKDKPLKRNRLSK